MVVTVLFKKIKSIFCLIINFIRKCFCCFRRKHSADEPLAIIVSDNRIENLGDSSFEKWESWDGPSCVISDGKRSKSESDSAVMSPLQMQILEYRLSQQRKMSQPPPEPPEEPNYFQDLAPKITKKPQVIILARPEEEQQLSNRISLSLSEPQLQGSELLEWHDDCNGGWEEEAEEELNVDAAIRDQRERLREERKAERLKKKVERENIKVLGKQSGHKIAMKLS